MCKKNNFMVEVEADATVMVDVVAASFDEAYAKAKERAATAIRVNETMMCRILSKTPARFESGVKMVRDWDEYTIRYPVCVKFVVLVYGENEDHACENAESLILRAVEIDYPCMLAKMEVSSFVCHEIGTFAGAA
jgi:hypothetical protein